MNRVIFHLGSNMGDRAKNLELARKGLESRIGKIINTSSIYETQAWGLADQDDFLNQALSINTNLQPEAILIEIKKLELEIGREATVKWGPRIIDIDLLLYGNEVIERDKLKIPHPMVADRNFVLVPLMEICGDEIHPVLRLTIEELYEASKDECEVWIYEE